jgi:hypothetical protein
MTPTQLVEDLTLVPLPQWWENPWFLLGVPALAGVLLYLATRWWMSRRPPALAPVEVVGPPVHDEYLRLLRDLRAKAAAMEAYPLAIEVSGILRAYLEAQYRFGIRYQTTREFLGSVASDGRFNPVHRGTLAGFLGLCDAVKFARQDVEADRKTGLVETAERFVAECAGAQTSGRATT